MRTAAKTCMLQHSEQSYPRVFGGVKLESDNGFVCICMQIAVFQLC